MFDLGGALPARHILGNYEIFEEVGRGGMGIVYRALDLSLDRVVAVKILRDDLRSQPQIVTRFSREAKAAASLDHANIVQIYSVGNEDGTPYIAMEFVDAVPLSTLMQREACLSCDQALDIAAQVASALSCAHDAHVVHRDIKPPNILVTDRGRAYVTDFGIAKILTMDDHLTVDGSRLGTPHYMSPERCKNGELTGSSDLYSLGVLLFQMLAGRLPYEASSSVELIRSIVYNPPTRLRHYRGDLPDDVERLVAWMIEKQPRHRPADGRTVCEAIQRVRQGKPLDTGGASMTTVFADLRQSFEKHAGPEPPPKTPRKLASGLTPITEAIPKTWRRKAKLGAALLGATFVAAAGVAWVTGGSDSSAQSWDPELANPQRWFADATVARFEDESPGVVRVALHLPNFTAGRVVPTADSEAFFVHLTGTPETRHEGGHVICEVDPVQRRASILASGLPQRDAAASSQFAERTVEFDYATAQSGAVLASRDGVFREFAIHPGGARMAVAIQDERGRSRLVEWTRTADGPFAEGRQLAPPGGSIEGLQYSPDGGHLAFIREEAANERSLWVAPANRGFVVSAPIARGDLSLGNRAFRTDGAIVVYSLAAPEKQSVTRLASVPDGKTVGEFDAGWSVSWRPQDAALVGTAPDRKGFTQIWSIEPAPPYRRTQLTHLDGGTGKTCTLSGDGTWVAAVRETPDEPVLVIARTGG